MQPRTPLLMNLFWKFMLLTSFCQQLSCQDSNTNVSHAEIDLGEGMNSTLDIQERAGSYITGIAEIVRPENTVAVVGESTMLNCRGRSRKIHWEFRLGDKKEMIVEECVPDKRNIDSYDVDKTKKACNLFMEIVSSDLAGTYFCLDRSDRSQTSSAELIVLESNPICNQSFEGPSLSADAEVTLTCSMRYFGAVTPVMEWTNEFGKAVPPTHEKSEKNFAESTLVVKADGTAFRSFVFKPVFNMTDLAPELDSSRKHIFKATNQPTHNFKWTSKSVEADYNGSSKPIGHDSGKPGKPAKPGKPGKKPTRKPGKKVQLTTQDQTTNSTVS